MKKIKAIEDLEGMDTFNNTKVLSRKPNEKENKILKDLMTTTKMKDVATYSKKLEGMKKKGYGTVDMK